MRVVQGGDRPGLALEPLLQVGVRGNVLGQHVDRDSAVEACVAGLVDLARYTQIVFESQRNTNFVFNRSKKGSAPCGKVEKEDDGAFGRRQSLQLRLS